MFQGYKTHIQNARLRGIPFALSFGEWAVIWIASGKERQRGALKGQYVMARLGDQGAYEPCNVYICLAEENRADRNRSYPLAGAMNGAFGRDFFAEASPAERERRSALISAKLKGLKKPDHMGANLSKTVTGRRRVYRDGRATWAYAQDADYPGL
jgi:hypothetical protein